MSDPPVGSGRSGVPFDADELWARVGDAGLLSELVEIFRREAPGELEKIRMAVALGDAPQLTKTAHRLRGSLLAFGAEAAGDTALALEDLGRQARLDGATDLVGRLEHEIARLSDALTTLVDRVRS